jgi:hypothetical protein
LKLLKIVTNYWKCLPKCLSNNSKIIYSRLFFWHFQSENDISSNFDYQLIYFWKFVSKGYKIDFLNIQFEIYLKKLWTIKIFCWIVYWIDYEIFYWIVNKHYQIAYQTSSFTMILIVKSYLIRTSDMTLKKNF